MNERRDQRQNGRGVTPRLRALLETAERRFRDAARWTKAGVVLGIGGLLATVYFGSSGIRDQQALAPQCGKPFSRACWLKVDNRDACWTWVQDSEFDERVTWSGQCEGGRANGYGVLTRNVGVVPIVAVGFLLDGRLHGRADLRNRERSVVNEHYVNGKRHGRSITHEAGGRVREGVYVDGKAHGLWSTYSPTHKGTEFVCYKDGELQRRKRPLLAPTACP